ncbi:archaellin/type IV pilin N-terminal domain-containing protein [Nanoarchaeota archaeon]
MVKIFSKKRGVSPLVATVLLIGFAVALGAIVMNWGKDYVEQSADTLTQATIRCSVDTGLSFAILEGKPVICGKVLDPENPAINGSLEFLVENGFVAEIDALQVRLIGSKSLEPVSLVVPESLLEKGGSKFMTFSYDDDKLGSIRQIKIIPLLRIDEDVVPCPDTPLKAESIPECPE